MDKQDNRVKFMAKLPPELHRWLKVQAFGNDESMNDRLIALVSKSRAEADALERAALSDPALMAAVTEAKTGEAPDGRAVSAAPRRKPAPPADPLPPHPPVPPKRKPEPVAAESPKPAPRRKNPVEDGIVSLDDHVHPDSGASPIAAKTPVRTPRRKPEPVSECMRRLRPGTFCKDCGRQH